MNRTVKQPATRKSFRDSLLFHAILVLLVCAVLYVLFFSSLPLLTRHGDEAKVPPVTGKNVKLAIKTIEDLGFDVRVDSTYEPAKKALIVLQQIPDGGEVVKRGRMLFLTVNKSVPPQTPMPNLVNLSFRSAA